MARPRAVLLVALLAALPPACEAGSFRQPGATAPPPPAASGGEADDKAILKGKMELTGPEQGFMGGDVKHEYMTTWTGDWQTEYGPKAKHFVDRWPREPMYPRGNWPLGRRVHARPALSLSPACAPLRYSIV